MATIPKQTDPTIEAMKRAIEALPKDSRDYLGASLIGDQCARKIWYEYNKYPRAPFDADSLMNFEDGHRTEELTAKRLRMVQGVELYTHDENGNQFGFSHFNGKFKGHADGVIRGLLQAPKAWHVWENKACGQKKFDEFVKLTEKYDEKSVLQKWNEQYFVQAQILMHFLKIDRHYLTVALAGGRDYASCRTNYQAEIAEKTIDKAEKIINAKVEPERISNKKDFFICSWCDFRDICHK